VNDASHELLDKHEVNQEYMYNRIKVELKGVQQTLQSSRIVSTAPLIAGTLELRDEPAQLHQNTDKIEARLRRSQEETMQAI
jgi:DNA transposition AAA+ family ATPase